MTFPSLPFPSLPFLPPNLPHHLNTPPPPSLTQSPLCKLPPISHAQTSPIPAQQNIRTNLKISSSLDLNLLDPLLNEILVLGRSREDVPSGSDESLNLSGLNSSGHGSEVVTEGGKGGGGREKAMEHERGERKSADRRGVLIRTDRSSKSLRWRKFQERVQKLPLYLALKIS